MSAWRVLGTMGLLLAAAPAGWTQTCPLTETPQAGECFKIQLNMKLSGEMRVRKDDKTVPLKLEADAVHEYPERILIVGRDGLVQKTARIYDTAKATIAVNGERVELSLRPDRRLFVAQNHEDQRLVYSPSGPLTREECQLTADQFDSAAVTGLLPGKEVSVGDTWKVHAPVVQALCNFEGLTEHNLTGKLDSVSGDTATFSLTGTAAGIDVGALVKVKIEATGRFDLKAKRLVALEWKQKDERDQGPVSPVEVVESTTTLKREAIEQPAALSDVALVPVPQDWEPPAPMTQLDYRDPQSRYSLLYPRCWHITAQVKDQLVMRCMDRGNFVAQATLTPWKKADKGKHLTPEEFKQAMNEMAGWEPEKILQAGEVPSDNGRWVYRYSTSGHTDGITAVQNCYLVATPEGEQLIVVFTMTPKQVDKLGARDLSLIGSL
ncbi:MAG TPA: hypothetical protein VMG10_24850, partial [Gemmataceae bacterium]|nr:hypothetical protein [Gemmataceae bacterium]